MFDLQKIRFGISVSEEAVGRFVIVSKHQETNSMMNNKYTSQVAICRRTRWTTKSQTVSPTPTIRYAVNVIDLNVTFSRLN
jgi:hypothetical protein